MSSQPASVRETLSERAARLLSRVEYRRADTSNEMEQMLRLRYDAYMREGAITPNREKKLIDRFDDVENAYTFGVYIDGELASSFRIHLLTPEYPDSPAMEAFPDFFKPALQAGKTFVDGNRFVANYDVARLFPELPFLTIRVPYMAATYFDTSYISATVRSEHQAFYRRSFGLKVASPPRPYPTLTKPISLMMLDYRGEGRDDIARRHPYFVSSAAERDRLFSKRSTRELLPTSSLSFRSPSNSLAREAVPVMKRAAPFEAMRPHFTPAA